jgi:hypothetical protein
MAASNRRTRVSPNVPGAAEAGTESDRDIRRDLIVPVSGTSHGMGLTTEILVLHFGEQFSLKIFLDRDGCGLE